MCDSDSREFNRCINRVPLADLPHVRVEMPLGVMNDLYQDVQAARRVLREGNPERKLALAQEILSRVSLGLDEACGGFLAPRNM